MNSEHRASLTKAHVVPFACFMVGLVLLQVADGLVGWDHPDAPWWRRSVEQWVYPLQVLVCAFFLIRYRTFYRFACPAKALFTGLAAGVVGIGLWCLPTMIYDWLGYVDEDSVPPIAALLGVAPRTEGFNPGEVFVEGGAAWWTSLLLRFVRAAVIVALVEEIFWRGFLMRFVMDPDGNYWKQPFGRPAMRSYLIVTLAFILIHQPVDYLGALVFGSLAYWVTVRTKSLGAVVAMHAIANLLMGLFAVAYGKYGLW